ncbi:hypothetical protein F2Q70_00014554, partial [Brassica cretica]
FFLAQLMQLQDNSSKRLSTLQSPSQSAQTRYGQLKFSKGSESGVFGPSRRARQSATMSPYSRPSRGRFENSANMKSYEAGESSISMPQTTTYGKHIGLEVGTPNVPRHSSQIARTITDNTGLTPAQLAAEKNHRQVSFFLGNARRLLEKRCDGSTPLGKLSKLGLAPVLWFMILLLLLIYTNSVILGCYLCLLGSLLLQHIK